jgi:hypothetical protein
MIFFLIFLSCMSMLQVVGSTFVASNDLRNLPHILNLAPVDISFSDIHLKEQYPKLVNSLESIQPLFDIASVQTMLTEAQELDFCTPPQHANALPIIARIQKSEEEIYALGDVHGSGSSVANFIDFIEADNNRVGVILGDIFDRGLGFNAFMFAISKCLEYVRNGNPLKLILMRGDHEEKFYNKKEGTEAEIKKIYGEEDGNIICESLWSFFRYLPCAYFVGKQEEEKKVWTIYSHALVHGNYNEYTINYDKEGNEINLHDINQKNENNIKSLLVDKDNTISKTWSLVDPSEVTDETLVNTVTYNNGFSNGRIRFQKGEFFGREFTEVMLAEWVNTYFNEHNELKAIIVGHQHPFGIEYQNSKDRIHYNMQKEGYLEIVFNDDKTRIIICGPGIYNLYGIAYAKFPYRDNEVFFGFSEQYVIFYDPITNEIKKELIAEDTDSKFSKVRKFISEKLLTEDGQFNFGLYNTINSSLQKQKEAIQNIVNQAKESLLDSYFNNDKEIQKKVLQENKQNTEDGVDLLTAAKLYKKIEDITSKNFFKPETIFILESAINSEIRLFEQYSKHRFSASKERINALQVFAEEYVFQPILAFITPIRKQYNLETEFLTFILSLNKKNLTQKKELFPVTQN